MAFDDTKTTEDGDGTVDSDEQVSADEWNAMVADQQSRVLFGTLAERPAAGDVAEGTPYLVTDLANDGGVITKVVGGAWQIQQIGDDTNRPDIVGGSADLESLSTDSFVNVAIAESGELQSKIDDVAANTSIGPDPKRGVVLLPANETFTATGIIIKPGVSIVNSGATFAPATDSEIIFVDNGGYLLGYPDIDLPETYTSEAVVLDTSRSTYGKYAIDSSANRENTHAKVNISVTGGNQNGDALVMRDAAGDGITIGTTFSVHATGVDRGVVFDSTSSGSSLGSFINVRGNVSISEVRWPMYHTGTGRATSFVSGELQAGGASVDGGIKNESDNGGPIYTGGFWDPQNANVSAVDGKRIIVNARQQEAAAQAQGNTPNIDFGSRIESPSGEGGRMVLTDDDNLFQVELGGARIEWYWNGTPVMYLFNTGDMQIAGDLTQNATL